MRRSALATLSALSFMGLLGVACGGGSSTGDTTGGTAGATSTGSPGSGGDQNTGVDASAGGSAGADMGAGGSPVTDAAQVSDVTCANATAFETFGVMVVPSSDSDATAAADAGACGAKANPCTSIQAGINAAAMAAKQYVYVAVGTYNEDNITLAKGVSLSGGWNTADWTRGCPIDAGATVIRNVKGTAVITAVDLGGSAAVDSVSLKSKPQSAVGQLPTGEGESLYGVLARGATTILTLQNVKIELANAGRGSNGSPGPDPGAAAAAGACPANPTPPGTTGSTGGSGTGAVQASFTTSGFKSSSGGNGDVGKSGGDGKANNDYGSNNFCGACVSTTPPCSWTSAAHTGAPGSPGCGGNPGGGGGGGRGGGAAVAVFAGDAKIQIQASTLVAGAGGNGGDGVTGKPGGAGTAGVTGAAYNCYSDCAVPACTCPNPPCFCLYACAGAGVHSTLAGGTASSGQTGGPGGTGGGGGGGFSYAIAKAGTGSVTYGADTTLAHGTPGAAGAGTNMGSVGTAGDVFE